MFDPGNMQAALHKSLLEATFWVFLNDKQFLTTYLILTLFFTLERF